MLVRDQRPTWVAFFSLVAMACVEVGCPEGTISGVASQAPRDLVYATNPAVYSVGVVIADNIPSSSGGAVTSYGVSPMLPAGLTFNPSTGVISGTPTAVAAADTYTVTATNPVGSTTVDLSLSVNQFQPLGAPTAVSATAGNGQASVSWTAPTSDGGSPVMSYTVTSSPGGFTATTNGNTTGVTVTGLANGTSYTFTVYATNANGNGPLSVPSNAVVPSASTAMGPLRVSTTNSHYFVDPSGNPVLLTGSHTWNDFQDLSNSASATTAFDFNAYINFLKGHGQNVTILWRKDLPTYCNWGAGGTWHVAIWPWLRTGPGTADDGSPKFDLTQFDQTYFDRLRARVLLLRQNGIYAIVQLFDGLELADNRCPADGYPFSSANNVNGAMDDGQTSSMDLSSATITGFQDAYVKKVNDTLNDLDNVLWEPSEEAPTSSAAWNVHMISLIHTYEAGKPLQHPVGYAVLQNIVDGPQFSSAAEWVAVGARVAPTNNQGKVIINDSDHSYFGLWNDSQQTNRNYVWENFTNGAQVLFMDPYEILWSGRNACPNAANGVCSDVVHGGYQDNLRQNLGYTLSYARKMNLLAMTPQPSLSQTGYCLAHVSASAHELLVYAPNGGTFTVDLSGTSGTISVEWFDPSTGSTTSGQAVTGGGVVSFMAPTGNGDAVLYLK